LNYELIVLSYYLALKESALLEFNRSHSNSLLAIMHLDNSTFKIYNSQLHEVLCKYTEYRLSNYNISRKIDKIAIPTPIILALDKRSLKIKTPTKAAEPTIKILFIE